MDCGVCPVKEECKSARGVALRKCSEHTPDIIVDRVNNVCPLEELMYTTFGLVVLNIAREVGDAGK